MLQQLDVLVGNTYGGNELHRNDGGGVFTAVTGISITQSKAYTLSVAWGDFDGDGDVSGCGSKARAPDATRRRSRSVRSVRRVLVAAARRAHR